MPKKKVKNKDNNKNLFLFLITIIMLITVINIEVFLYKKRVALFNQKEVLGVQTVVSEELDHWKSVVQKNPWYLPAWVEIANIAKETNNAELINLAFENIQKIDPNNILLQD